MKFDHSIINNKINLYFESKDTVYIVNLTVEEIDILLKTIQEALKEI